MAEEKKRGGKRPGAGRPKGTNTTPIPFKIRNELLVYVNSKPNRNGFINDCIQKQKDNENK